MIKYGWPEAGSQWKKDNCFLAHFWYFLLNVFKNDAGLYKKQVTVRTKPVLKSMQKFRQNPMYKYRAISKNDLT